MRNLATIGVLIGAGFILLGYFGRTPAQSALSNAIIGIGAAILILLLIMFIVAAVRHRPK